MLLITSCRSVKIRDQRQNSKNLGLNNNILDFFVRLHFLNIRSCMLVLLPPQHILQKAASSSSLQLFSPKVEIKMMITDLNLLLHNVQNESKVIFIKRETQFVFSCFQQFSHFEIWVFITSFRWLLLLKIGGLHRTTPKQCGS